MPKFVIEKQYLLPVYKHEIVEAPNLATACCRIIDADDWEGHQEDYDNARPTTIIKAVEVPDDYSPDYRGVVGSPAAHALYGAGLADLEIPAEFAEGDPASVGRVEPQREQNLSDRELATVLAGLRCWQKAINRVRLEQALADIATAGGTLLPLRGAEIDALCERLNSGVRPPAATEGIVKASRALAAAAENLLNAYGGDTPDWLRDEAERLDQAMAAARAALRSEG
jgi:hypothetical protein